MIISHASTGIITQFRLTACETPTALLSSRIGKDDARLVGLGFVWKASLFW